MELTQEDLNEIARLIQGGNTSGRLDSEDENGKQYYITWNLNADKWQDD